MLFFSPAEFPEKPMTTIKRIFALSFIFVCTTIAWMILGGTIFQRTYGQDEGLRSKVSSTWGTTQSQAPPSATYVRESEVKHETLEEGRSKTIVETARENILLPLTSTRADVRLQLQHRQKGLLWYSTYKVAFAGEYTFENNSGKGQEVTFSFPLPAQRAMYDNMVFVIDGTPVVFTNLRSEAQATTHLDAGKVAVVKVGYASQGMDHWNYQFGNDVTHVRDFKLSMSTNFKDIDFPDNTLSPSEKHESGDGWQLDWNYKDLLSGYQIGMIMPEKLQPGPLAGRISFFAPVSLFFFFFLVFIITTIRGVDLHPMNYFFLAAAFFAFHLLMGLPGRSLFHSLVVLDLGDRLSCSGDQLYAPGHGTPLRSAGMRTGPACLPGAVFLRVFLQGIHRAGRDHRIDYHVVPGHADDRKDQLVRKVRATGSGASAVSGTVTPKPTTETRRHGENHILHVSFEGRRCGSSRNSRGSVILSGAQEDS
jgi:hypothetical protein